MKFFSLCMIFICHSMHALFSYDRAVSQAQQGDWPAAKHGLNSLLADSPHQPDLLYDAGVAAFKVEDYEKAYAYFSKVAQDTHANPLLQEQATFNAGNAQVKREKLQEALECYDKTLELNPNNEPAKHNKELVKKMLEQQKQQQQKQDKTKDKKEDQKQDQQKNEDQQNQQDQKDQERNEQDQKDEQDQQQNQQQPQDKSQQDSSKEQSGNKKKQPSDMNQQEKQKNNESPQQQERKKGDSEQTPEQQEQAGQESGKEKSPADQYAQQQQKAAAADEQEKKNQKLAQALNPQLQRFMAQQEKKDADANKQLTKAMMATKGGQRNEDHNW